jgi:hypothetical protein
MAGLYLQVEVLELDDDRLIEAGMEGRGAYLTVGLLAKRTETDGWVTMAQLRKEGVTAEMVSDLFGWGLLDGGDDGRVRQVRWLDRNPSQAAIDQQRQAKADAGKRGNHDRWNHPGPVDSCPKCHVVAPCDPTPIAPPNPVGSPDTESEADTKSEAAIPRDGSQTEEPPSEPAPGAVADQQAVNRALLRYSHIVTDRTPGVQNSEAFAASVRRDAIAEGIKDDLRALLESGLDVEAAATARAGGSAERDPLAASIPAAESAHPLLRPVPTFCDDGSCDDGWVETAPNSFARCPKCNADPLAVSGGDGHRSGGVAS